MREATHLRSAYLALLNLPLGSVSRSNLQAAMAAVRDELARVTERTSEAIQTENEQIAAMSIAELFQLANGDFTRN